MSQLSSKRATLHDVARAAGVSYQTVSRVINNSPNVADETRERVEIAIRALEYQPNRAAQLLSSKQSYIIEVITLDVFTSDAMMLSHIVDSAKQQNYNVTVAYYRPDELAQALSTADSRLIDGIILVNTTIDVTESTLLSIKHKVPFVQIGGCVGGQFPAVLFDQYTGGKAATEHLIQLGHRNIAMINGSLQRNIDAAERFRAWRETLAAHQLPPGPVAEGIFDAHSGYQAMKALLNQSQPFTGVFIANDEMALGAYSAIHEQGLRIPDDISIVGFNDWGHAPYFMPKLTTVHQPLGILGKLAVEHLLSFINSPGMPYYQRVLTPTLVIRESTRSLK